MKGVKHFTLALKVDIIITNLIGHVFAGGPYG